MAKKKKKKDDAEGAEEEGGSKLKLIIAAVVLVVVGAAVGGKVLGGGGSPAAAAGVTTTTTEPAGVVSTLAPITLNLADGRFLKLGLAFEVRAGEEYPAAADVAADKLTDGFAREVDTVIGIVSSYTYEDLIAPQGKVNVKRKLLEELQRVSEDAIKDLYFHQFVMQ